MTNNIEITIDPEPAAEVKITFDDQNLAPIKINGTQCEVLVFADELETSAGQQIQRLADHKIAKNAHIRIMPDVHAGSGCVIGYTARLTDFVIPNLIGVDIGCGVLAQRVSHAIPEDKRDKFFEMVDKCIRGFVPSGFDSHKNQVPTEEIEAEYNKMGYKTPFDEYLQKLLLLNKKVGSKALYYIGTLGGGNHFIELEQEDSGAMWLTVHTGSRNMGLKVCMFHQNLASDVEWSEQIQTELVELVLAGDEVQVNDRFLKDFTKQLERLAKERHRERDLTQLRRLVKAAPNAPKELWFLSGKRIAEYCADMDVAQVYAQLNRRFIMNAVMGHIASFCERHELSALPKHPRLPDRIESVHNYINFEDGIVRKGSISSYTGHALIIPLNMRDGVVLGFGRSNPEWNFSAPHGAGRKCSRTEAKKTLTVVDFAEDMKNVWTSCVSEGTLDEAPAAYKDSQHAVKWFESSVEIVERLKSVYNFKAGSSDE